MSVDNERLLRRLADRRAVLRRGASLSILPFGTAMLGACDEDAPADATTAGAATTLAATRMSAATTSFAIAVLPDTQFYSRYATTDENEQFQKKYGSTPFATQTQWIVDNAAAYRIPFVIHLGDVVDQVGRPNQWRIADAAMKQLEGGRVPYSVLAGNHDVVTDYEYRGPWDQGSGTDAQRTPGSEPYLQWFPRSRAATQSTFRERDASGFHEYHVFEAHGVRFMVLSLSWRISDAGIAWARGVIRANPTLPVILSSHQLLNIDKDGLSPLETEYGKMLWDRLIRDSDQIFMTLNGHHHGAAWLSKTNDFGNQVEQMVVDYQMDYQGGNALMRLYEVDFTANRIDVMSFSPWVVQKPKATLNQFDRAILTERNQQFTIPLNFRKRFAGFLKFRPTLSTTGAPILPVVKANLLAGYTDPVPPVMAPPRDANDFPVVADTYAHWRPAGGRNGQAVAIGEALPDISGNGFPMARMPLSGPAQAGDVIWTDDRHYLSSAPGSVRFLNTDRVSGRFSSFQTAVGAGVNNRSFWDGYTVEAFIKIDANWTRENNRWANVLARLGNRGNLPGFAGGDREASSVLFAISSLREIQWEVVPASNSSQPKANWSGELLTDTWYHVAIVCDPATRDTTLYVEGAPVLRNTSGFVGMRSQGVDKPWILGATHWNGDRDDSYFGSIGEVRLVGRPLTPAQWLTARRA